MKQVSNMGRVILNGRKVKLGGDYPTIEINGQNHYLHIVLLTYGPPRPPSRQ